MKKIYLKLVMKIKEKPWILSNNPIVQIFLLCLLIIFAPVVIILSTILAILFLVFLFFLFLPFRTQLKEST